MLKIKKIYIILFFIVSSYNVKLGFYINGSNNKQISFLVHPFYSFIFLVYLRKIWLTNDSSESKKHTFIHDF